MPRRGIVRKRKPQPDPLFNSSLVGKFINLVLGKVKRAGLSRLFTILWISSNRNLKKTL